MKVIHLTFVRQAVGIIRLRDFFPKNPSLKQITYGRSKNVIDMRPGKGFTTSQSNEHLRVFSDKDRAKRLSGIMTLLVNTLTLRLGKVGLL